MPNEALGSQVAEVAEDWGITDKVCAVVHDMNAGNNGICIYGKILGFFVNANTFIEFEE